MAWEDETRVPPNTMCARYSADNSSSICNSNELKVLFVVRSDQTNTTAVMNECRKFPTLRASSDCPYPGYCAEIIQLLARHMRMRVKPVLMKEEGVSKSTFWESQVAMLNNGTIDTLCPFQYKTSIRQANFDFSFALHTVRSVFAAHRHFDEETWNLFRPYTLSTWAFIIGTLVVYMLVGVLIARVEFKLGRRACFLPGELVWKMVRLQLRQTDQLTFTTVAGNFVSISFCLLQCILLLSLYQTWIVYSLTKPKSSAPFDDLRGLLRRMESGKERYLMRHNDDALFGSNWFLEHVQKSSKYPYRQFRAIFELYPPILVNVSNEIIEHLDQGGYVIWMHTRGRLYHSVISHCDIILVDDGYPTRHGRLLFRKGSPLLPRINEAILSEAVAIRRIMERYDLYLENRRGRICAETEEGLRRYKPFGTGPLVGLCVVMAVFILTTLIAFALELVVRGNN